MWTCTIITQSLYDVYMRIFQSVSKRSLTELPYIHGTSTPCMQVPCTLLGHRPRGKAWRLEEFLTLRNVDVHVCLGLPICHKGGVGWPCRCVMTTLSVGFSLLGRVVLVTVYTYASYCANARLQTMSTSCTNTKLNCTSCTNTKLNCAYMYFLWYTYIFIEFWPSVKHAAHTCSTLHCITCTYILKSFCIIIN